MQPLLIMLAGPNGAGKSTFYEAHLSHLGLPFLNADVLAAHAGIDAYTAANEIASIRDAMVDRKESFITETVLSDPVGAKVDFLRQTVRSGYDVQLIFIGVENAALSAERVAARTAAGGHDVPAEKLKCRYPRSMANLERAIKVLPRVLLYDNSTYENPHRFLADFRDGTVVRRGKGRMPKWARSFVRMHRF